ncbi:MAG TPA: D-glycerate dehydrogenase, partial [Actinomycetota bacterium]|nr:D-glycerate dehydrogenase [Actinomycetota bacterium]
MSDRPRVVVTRRLPEPVEQELVRLFDARLNPEDRPLSPAELAEAAGFADALLPTVTDKITASVLGVEPLRARIVANFGVGYNNIDVAAAKAVDVAVTNTPDVLTDCTADLAMTLMLSVARRAGEGERHLRSGSWTGWRPTHMLGTKVTGKTLGVVGLGRIGRAVARRAHHGFGMRILYYDAMPVPAEEVASLQAEQRSLEDLLAESDFVSLHCPATPQTRHLMNAATLKAMKPDAFLINSARGDVVDEAALVEALRSGTIAGAGLDVYEGEPSVTAELLTMENVVLLPHLG